MTGRKFFAVGFVAVLVLAAAVTVFLGLRPGAPVATDAAGPLNQPVPAPAPTVAGSLPPDGVAEAATTVTPSARSVASSRAVPATTRPTNVPAPFVQNFAAQPGVKPLPARPSPTATVSIAPNIDGCDHGYGTRTQCVPWTFPASATDKCAWLAAQGFTKLTVHGKDRHQLDPDRNGIACDA
ncbi:hypothetical protein KOI35_17225 [Actinoplanes bogorensis]|uniref:Excalibur calcium-binding domain-containing protein n=1 Tax=Paractinoplanes bogorensis TaxID=1610840 RepID=A0ABS5YP67_9ACTN|nr:hypothetical protein [Actinoplanes bogorensis]MBU2665248.1 hypothetical protein [Actinoplanes bogorensis]